MDAKVLSPIVLDGVIHSIKFSTSSFDEICKYSINECPITHPSQLSNPFLGLPLESGKCEACGTAENGNCEGHFGYIELPVPIFHPSHISELRDLLSLVCLKCLRMKKAKIKDGKTNASGVACSYCKGLPPIYIKEVKTSDGAICLELSVSSRNRLKDGFWNFLDRFGYHYDDGNHRPLLPTEALNILEKMSEETKRKLSAKGFFAQVGYIMQFLPVPPNCLLLPEISDGKSIMSTDISISLLKRILNKIEHIKRSRSGPPNFESHEVECNDLQLGIAEYIHLRGTTKTPHDSSTKKFVMGQEDAIKSSSKQWLEKMKTLFISKGSGFSSRSVITGDTYTGVDQIGIPTEIAKRVTFEERVNQYNIEKLQKLVDDRLCVTYKDGNSTYAIAVGAHGHTTLKIGQVINRSIIDGDIIFINRPPSTHKHSLQAFTAYIHDDHTVKINPLVCAPLGADFDGDCVHIFYPQSLAAKAEVMELFCVEQQLLSSHTGQLNFQLVNDSLLSLKFMANTSFLTKESAQQLGMLVSKKLPPPAVVKAQKGGLLWTVHQILQCALPPSLDSSGQRHLIDESEILELEFGKDFLQSSLSDVVSSIFISKGPKEALTFFNSLQPLLMEVLSLDGFSISLKDFSVRKSVLKDVQRRIQNISSLLPQTRISYNELLEQQIDRDLARLKVPVVEFILQSCLGLLIDSKSESAINKVVQQVGFLGLQLFDRGKLYSKAFVEDIYNSYASKYLMRNVPPSAEAYGLVKGSLFHGLNPFESFVHSISSREVIIRSSRGLTEPGVLFKNLMAILRDIAITYDGTVRHVCSNSVIQFGYELGHDKRTNVSLPAGEPVGVLAATAISTPAYKAVLDSSQNTNSSWESMKEILQCKSSYQNTATDRRVILYLNDCNCGKKFCKEKSALTVQNCLRSVTLKHCAVDFSVVYESEIIEDGSPATSGLLGHIHLDMMKLRIFNQSVDEIHRKCEEVKNICMKKKKHSHIFSRIELSSSEVCHPKFIDDGNISDFPCLQFSYRAGSPDETVDEGIEIMTNSILPILLDTIVKGDPRLETVNLYWTGPDSTSWVANPTKDVKGEWAIDVVVQETEAKKNGDAWRLVLDACIPVIHLIDTTRSIPYGIKQIKDIFGISCAFDQCVQRLSKSIKRVSKGVIIEHLVLVGNTMTCNGNLIGFNTGGFKSLFKSLGVQVPFTEATLFTPMRCFERAAEKCHTDSLGSIVSSISWGKHVAVGTGSNFEIIWGQKNQASSNTEVGKDVYDLLSWVREPHEKDMTGACVGSDIEDFLDDYDDGNIPMSPEPSVKPTFEDFNEPELKNNSDDWLGWGNNKTTSDDGGWGSTPLKQSNNSFENDGWISNNVAKANLSDWGNKKTSSDMGNSNWNKNPVKESENNGSSWENKKLEIKESDNWSASKENKADEPSSWGSDWTKKKVGESSGWGAANTSPSQKENVAWSTKKDMNKENESFSWSTKETKSAQNNENDGWLTKKDDSSKVNEPAWGQDNVDGAWSSQKQTNKEGSSSAWGQNNDDGAWSSQKQTNKEGSSSEWGQNNGDGAWSTQKQTNKEESSSAWGAKQFDLSSGNDSNAWSSKKQTSENAPAWGSGNEVKDSWNGGNNEGSNPWTTKKSEDENGADGNSQGWKSRGSWGRGRGGREGGRGRGGREGGRGRGRGRNDSPRPWQDGNRTGWSQAVAFTPEEEKILVDIEPVMNTIRTTIREISDGDRLSPENQKFITENVLAHHPEKQTKVAGEIDYITAGKHSTFTESRCFYVVLTDGTRSDFSYIKCMKNFVNANYPEHAESFNAKYFRRRDSARPRNEVGQQQGAEEAQTEPGNSEVGQQQGVGEAQTEPGNSEVGQRSQASADPQDDTQKTNEELTPPDAA